MTSGGMMRAAVRPTGERLGIRTVAMAAVAGLSTFDPALTLSVGPAVAIAVIVLGRPLSFKMTTPVVLAALFASWAWVSLTWSPVRDFTLATAILWSQVLLIFIAAYELIKSRAQLRMVAASFVTGAVFTVAKNVYFGPEGADAVVIAANGGRAILGNANVNYVAYALTTALAMVVLLWVSRVRKISVVVLGGAAVVLAVGLGVSDTRAAQLGAGLLGAWVLFCWVTRVRPLKLLVAGVLGAAVCIITGIADQASLAFESGARVTGDWSGRLVIWPMARDMWAENPLAGIGGGAFIVTNGLGIGAHNIILQTGTGLGLVGVGLLVGLIWSALAGAKQPLLIGAFLAASAPMYLSGMWEAAPAAWVAIAIFSRVRVLGTDAPRQEPKTPAAKRNAVPDWAKTRTRKSMVGGMSLRPPLPPACR